MGISKRYAAHYDRLACQGEGGRIIAEGGDPAPLLPKGVDEERFPVTRAERAIDVQARTRYVNSRSG